MKRVAVILFCFLVFFTACKNERQNAQIQNSLDRGFSAVCCVSFDELDAKFNLVYRGVQSAYLEVIEPKEIEGAVFESLNGEFLIKYKGLSFPLSSLKSEVSAVPNLIISALKKAQNSKKLYFDSKTNEILINEKDFSVVLENDSFKIKSLNISGENIKAVFEDFQFLS